MAYKSYISFSSLERKNNSRREDTSWYHCYCQWCLCVVRGYTRGRPSIGGVWGVRGVNVWLCSSSPRHSHVTGRLQARTGCADFCKLTIDPTGRWLGLTLSSPPTSLCFRYKQIVQNLLFLFPPLYEDYIYRMSPVWIIQSEPAWVGLVWQWHLSLSLSLYFHVSMLNKTENWRDSTGVLQHNVLVLIHLYTLWTLEIQSFDCCHYTSLKTGRHLPPPSVRSSLQILTNPRWRSSYSLCWPASSQTAKYTI